MGARPPGCRGALLRLEPPGDLDSRPLPLFPRSAGGAPLGTRQRLARKPDSFADGSLQEVADGREARRDDRPGGARPGIVAPRGGMHHAQVPDGAMAEMLRQNLPREAGRRVGIAPVETHGMELIEFEEMKGRVV